MGIKTIWDGHHLPPVGYEVLIHLASCDKWVPHTVKGHRIEGDLGGNLALHRVFIDVGKSAHPHSSDNSRLLMDVRPVDWR